MEELTSSLIITFMERSLANAFTPGRRLSLGYNYWWSFGQVSTSLFSQGVADSKDVEGNESIGIAARASFAYTSENNLVLHLGLGSFIENTENNTHEIKINAYPETKVSKVKYLDTDDISDVEYNNVSNIELAFSYKFIRVQAEYMINKIFRKDFENTGITPRDLSFSGYYILVSGFLTGEYKPYSMEAGEFLPITPKKDFGAIEFSFRLSKIDLNDIGTEVGAQRIEGGTSTQYTLGLTWFFNTNFRLMLNYSYSDNSEWADGHGDYESPKNGIDFHIFQSRFIANF
jgi:phosphate-selective porin OprO/OprP